MARGKQGKNFPTKLKKGKGNFKRGKVNKINKKNVKKYSDRDIYHRDQAMRAHEFKEKAKSQLIDVNRSQENENLYEDIEIDAVDELLSTFSNKSTASKHAVIESDIDSSEEDAEAIDSMEVSQMGLDESSSLVLKDVEDIEIGESDDDYADGEVGKHDEENDDNDPFIEHLTSELDPTLLASVEATPMRTTIHNINWPMLGDLKVDIPVQILDSTEKTEAALLLDDNNFTKPGTVPKMINSTDLSDLSIKSQIHKNIKKANKKQLEVQVTDDGFTHLQNELFSIINNYQDLYYSDQTLDNLEETRFVYCLHTVNHILKTRLKIIHHNERLNKKDGAVPDEFRDQGLVRPKVLIIAPFRDSCYRIVNMISEILLCDNRANVINKARFTEEFTGGELFMPKRNRKPEDFERLFSGNVDDSFRIGINFTKKSLKLYSDFYSSDVIIASPLGLRMLIGAEGDKDRDFDFLASIELLIIDQTEVFLMQNWDHVLHIFNHMHIQPRESHGTDFSRVRPWALNGWTRHYRQTLLFSSIVTPELNAVFSRKCSNYAGAVRTVNTVTSGSISKVVIPLPHVYRRFDSSSVIGVTDDRFQFFVEKVLPQISEASGVLIYVPSYFDYVRLRNYLKEQDRSFVQICEYSKDAKVARARDMFYHSEAKILLYSERFHFFRRINLKGIRHLVFYQPPTFPHYYSEMCNLMQESNQNKAVQDANFSVTVVFCKYDVHQLSGIVRTARTARIVSSPKSVHMFTTGSSSNNS